MILIVAGVSGSGKTTVGAMLAGRLRWQFADADDFHPESNMAKMHAGVPLTDEDRLPWLHAIAAWMDDRIAAGESAVIACSALKRSYRDLLLNGRRAAPVPTTSGSGAELVFLQVSKKELERRLAARHGHFFPGRLLDSQLATLELPQPDEQAVRTVTCDGDAARTTDEVLAALKDRGRTLDS